MTSLNNVSKYNKKNYMCMWKFPITNPRSRWKCQQNKKCSTNAPTETQQQHTPHDSLVEIKESKRHITFVGCCFNSNAKRERAMWKFLFLYFFYFVHFSSKNISTIHKIYLTRKTISVFSVFCVWDADFSFSIYICCSLERIKIYFIICCFRWVNGEIYIFILLVSFFLYIYIVGKVHHHWISDFVFYIYIKHIFYIKYTKNNIKKQFKSSSFFIKINT